MPSTPTTKSQVQAYKFVIRRMQSALVRKDAVMLHDPMRTHTRATYVGIALGVLGIAGFLIAALFSQSPSAPSSGIVISKETGQIYVLHDKPHYLTPVFNMASARLLLMAQQEKANSGGSQSVAAPPEATVVKEEFLQGIPTARKTGILDGPEVLPGKDSPVRARGKWGVCDRFERDPTLNNPTRDQKTTTTAMVGVQDFGTALAKNQGLLVTTGDGEKTYLVFRTPPGIDLKGSDAVRAEVDLSNQAIKSTFDPNNLGPRRISVGLLNAIPPVDELKALDLSKYRQESPPASSLPAPGTVISVNNAGTSYYVVLHDGLQQITQAAAKLLGYQQGSPQTVDPGQITGVAKDRTTLQLQQFPDEVPQLLPPNKFPTVCLDWRADLSDAPFPKQQTEVTVGQQLPINPSTGQPISNDDAVQVNTANSDGVLVNRFWMPHGKAAVVHSATSPGQFRSGPIYIISDRGVRYSVPDVATAVALGVSDDTPGAIDPAPDSIVRLLPGASELSSKLVNRTFDSVGLPGDAGIPTTLPAKPTVGNEAQDGIPNVP